MAFGRSKQRNINSSSTRPKPGPSERITNKLDHVIVSESKPKTFFERCRGFIVARFGRNRNRNIVVLVLLVVMAAGTIAYFAMRDEPEPPSPRTGLATIVDAKDPGAVVGRYGKDYDALAAEVQSTDYTKWDRATLNKAYFSLVYADKIGAFNQVYTMLSLIDAAGQNGLDIDDNDYGIDHKQREAIRERADANAKSASAGQSEGQR